MLKLFVLLCLAIPTILALSEEMQELANELHRTCVSQTGASDDVIDSVNKNKVLPDDENLKCYLKCLMAEMAVISDDGVVDPEAVIAVMPEEMQVKVAAGVRKCGSKQGANPCESAWLTHRCYLEENPNEYMLF